ncbi:MAG TPA: BMC domain-containing protein [bacterium]|nr:BMC domain-containing protein [bacterium]
MERQALGLIETVGLVGAMEAADAAAKASSIVVIRTEQTDPALVTIYIEGDLAAVQAAVEAGVNACLRLGRVHAHTVIPRPHDDLGGLIDRPNQKWRGRTASRGDAPSTAPEPSRLGRGTPDYDSMTVVALRSLARRRGDLPIAGREIALADKDTLLRLLRQADARRA